MNPVFLTMILIAAARGQDNQIKCSVTVSPVPEGHPVEIVCNFPSDFMKKDKPLYVFKNEKKVVTCKPTNGIYECDPEPRYYISGPLINGEVRLLIPQAAKQHEGNYTCEGEGFQSRPCELKVAESPVNTSCTIESKHNDTDIIFFFSKNLRLVNETIFIYKQPFDSEKNDTIVLYCLIRDHEDPKCDKNVFSFDSTRMTLHINSTSAKDEGRYTAKVPSSSPGISTPCDLILPATISNKDRPCVPCTTTCPTYSAEPISSASPIADEPYAQCADKDTTLRLLICLTVMVGVYLLVRFAFLIYKFKPRAQLNDGDRDVVDPMLNCQNGGGAGASYLSTEEETAM